ncbi:MAG: hypothetical protein WDM91_18675 [Rhizomicrobium sp.]
MKTLIATVFALTLLGAPAASAEGIGLGVHVGGIGVGAHVGGHGRNHHRHCRSWSHHRHYCRGWY